MSRLTQKAFGRHVGISQPAVARLVGADLLDMQRGLDQCRLDYCEHLRRVAAGHHSEDGKLDAVEEKALLTRSQRVLNEHKIAENERRLMDVAEVEKQAFRAARLVRNAMLAIPGRIAATLIGRTDRQIERALTDEIRAGLTAAAVEIEGETDGGA